MNIATRGVLKQAIAAQSISAPRGLQGPQGCDRLTFSGSVSQLPRSMSPEDPRRETGKPQAMISPALWDSRPARNVGSEPIYWLACHKDLHSQARTSMVPRDPGETEAYVLPRPSFHTVSPDSANPEPAAHPDFWGWAVGVVRTETRRESERAP